MKNFSECFQEYIITEGLFDKWFGSSDKTDKSASIGFFGWLKGLANKETSEEDDKVQSELKKMHQERLDKVKQMQQKLKSSKEQAFIDKMRAAHGLKLQQMELKNSEKVNNYKTASASFKRAASYWSKTSQKLTDEELKSVLNELNKTYDNIEGGSESLEDKTTRLLLSAAYDKKTGEIKSVDSILKAMSSSEDPNMKELNKLYNDHKEEFESAIKEGSWAVAIEKAIKNDAEDKINQESLQSQKEAIAALEKKVEKAAKYNELKTSLSELEKKRRDSEVKKWEAGIEVNSDSNTVSDITNDDVKNLMEKAYNKAKEEVDSNEDGAADKFSKIFKEKLKGYGIDPDNLKRDKEKYDLDIIGGESTPNFEDIVNSISNIEDIKKDVKQTADEQISSRYSDYLSTKEECDRIQKEIDSDDFEEIKKMNPKELADLKSSIKQGKHNIEELQKKINDHETSKEALKQACEEYQNRSETLRNDSDSELQKYVDDQDDGSLSPGEIYNTEGKRGYVDKDGEFHERPKASSDSEKTAAELEKYTNAAKANIVMMTKDEMNNLVKVKKEDDGKYTVTVNGETKSGLSAEEAAKYEILRKSVNNSWNTEKETQMKAIKDAINKSKSLEDLKKNNSDNPIITELADAIKNGDTENIKKYEEAFKHSGNYAKDFSISDMFNSYEDLPDEWDEEDEVDVKDRSDEEDEKIDDDGDIDDDIDDKKKPKRFIKKRKGKRKGTYRYEVYDANGKPKKDEHGKIMTVSVEDWRANRRAWNRYNKNNVKESLSEFIKNRIL